MLLDGGAAGEVGGGPSTGSHAACSSTWFECHLHARKQTYAHSLTRAQAYFSDVWVNRQEASLDTEIFSDLPAYLRSKVAQFVTMDYVLQVCVCVCVCVREREGGCMYVCMEGEREMSHVCVGCGGYTHNACARTRTHTQKQKHTQVPIFRDAEDGLQQLVAQHLRPVDVTPGHDLCRQGEEGDRLWICTEGELMALQVGRCVHGGVERCALRMCTCVAWRDVRAMGCLEHARGKGSCCCVPSIPHLSPPPKLQQW